jgi:hypothetical protein
MSIFLKICIFFSLSSGILIFNVGSLCPQPPKLQRACDPIAKVLSSSDRSFVPGQKICNGEKISINSNVTGTALCYSRLKVLPLNSLVQECVPSPTSQLKPCAPMSFKECYKTKGTFPLEAPTLFYPYSYSILNPIPRLSWLPVQRATSYLVRFKGHDFSWEAVTQDTSFPYPSTQPRLSPGNVYKVTIIALNRDSPLCSSEAILSMASPREIQQISSVASQIQHLDSIEDDRAIDLDTLYMSGEFLTEAISTLQARIHAGSHNPAIYRLLGDRFKEAGLPALAKEQYIKASSFAHDNPGD